MKPRMRLRMKPRMRLRMKRHVRGGQVGAKGGAQHTLLSLLAVPSGILFARAANATPARLAAAFLLLTAAHVRPPPLAPQPEAVRHAAPRPAPPSDFTQ